MTQALDIWQKCSQKSKFDLAELSGIWRVHLDRSSLQTRTLDKYFSIDTLPQNPRWRDVLSTADYVLAHCQSGELGAELDHLKSLRDQVKKTGDGRRGKDGLSPISPSNRHLPPVTRR